MIRVVCRNGKQVGVPKMTDPVTALVPAATAEDGMRANAA